MSEVHTFGINNVDGRVCERKGADSTQDCETLDSATLKPDANWGWCLVSQSEFRAGIEKGKHHMWLNLC